MVAAKGLHWDQREGKAMKGSKILLVDDEVVFTSNMGKLLTNRGYKVTATNSGDEALQALEKENFDVVVLDLKMPGMDGLTTLKEIKKKVLPEINDEFAKDVGEHKNVDELKTRVRADIEFRKRNEQAAGQREEILNKLVSSYSFDVPEGLVEKELMSMARSQAMHAARRWEMRLRACWPLPAMM